VPRSKRSKGRPTRSRTAKRRPPVAAGLPPFEGGHRLLALDTSSTCVGWAVFDNGELTESGQYVQEGAEHGEKLTNFLQWLVQTIGELAPNDVVFEAPYAGRRRFTFGVLSKYVALVELAHFYVLGREMPAENKFAAHLVKKIIGVRKGASHVENKRLMVNEVNQLYGLSLKFKQNDKRKTTTEDDRADAIALGRAWLLKYHPEWMGEADE
jgi:hypothetical protein